MVRIAWDQAGKRTYETGTSKGVLFVKNDTGGYDTGVPWNGLVSVKQKNDGGDETPLYADNVKYLSLYAVENLKGSIDAFTYPDEFEVCDGSAAVNPGVYVGQQTRVPFGLAYSTIVGNDTQGQSYGEKIHLIYNMKVSPSERAYETVNDKPTALTFSWDFSTTPVDLSDVGLDSAAGITVEKTKVSASAWTALTDKIYGTATNEPSMPTIQEVISMTATTTTTTV